MASLWWMCPRCNKKVNFFKQLDYVFDENGEAEFEPDGGLPLHTIECDCGIKWFMSISKAYKCNE